VPGVYRVRYASGAPQVLEAGLGLGGKAFTAHPHTDPHTGRVVGWGWKSLVAQRAVEATFWEWDEAWVERGETVHMLAGRAVTPGCQFAYTWTIWVSSIEPCFDAQQ
jgi:hypothetical protein